jgi:acetyl-CoA acetyltransferase
MGITSENDANDYNISRRAQDEFAAKSFQKAAAASKAGKFKAEIIPITAKFIDPNTEKVSEIVVDQDDGIRDGVTVESLAKLKPAFTKDGSTHSGKLFGFPTYITCRFFSSKINNLPRKRIASIRRRRCCSPCPSFRSQTPRSPYPW